MVTTSTDAPARPLPDGRRSRRRKRGDSRHPTNDAARPARPRHSLGRPPDQPAPRGDRRSEVKDFHLNAGYPALHFIRKGGEDHSLAIHPQAAERIRVYLEAAGHAQDREGPLFRPVRPSWRVGTLPRHLDPDLIDRMVRKYVGEIGLHRGFSAHSMRAHAGMASRLAW